MVHPIPAYLDPATGSIAYQVAISGVLAAAAAVRMYWSKIRKVFGVRGRRDVNVTQPDRR